MVDYRGKHHGKLMNLREPPGEKRMNYTGDSLFDISFKKNGVIVILEHEASFFRYAPDVPVCEINDEKLYRNDWDGKPDEFIDYFLRTLQKVNKPIVVFHFTPYVAFGLKLFIEFPMENDNVDMLVFSFFHDDETTRNIVTDPPEDMLTLKNNLIEAMDAFPFIHKIGIPVDYEITKSKLNEMFISFWTNHN